ncbi:MAG: hypothetical protein IT440_06105, partial [Phycisphaeraceae bacterium]|nr:hypothetical protein [Phycisphaeraceae bacterium]
APTAPSLRGWKQLALRDMVSGESEAFKPIPGPQSLEACGASFGYGWYRLTFKGSRKANVSTLDGGDRLHLYHQGKLVALAGIAPGATEEPVNVTLAGHMVVLADNLGRYCAGAGIGERKGLPNHLVQLKPLTLDKPTHAIATSPDPFAISRFVPMMRQGERNLGDVYAWSFKAQAGKPMVLDLSALPVTAMVLLHDKPVALHVPNQTGHRGRYVLDSEMGLKTGLNRLKIAFFTAVDTLNVKVDPARQVRLFQIAENLTAGATWAFAPWTVPALDQYQPATKTATGVPTWHRCAFDVTGTETPLWLELTGMSKGQMFLNGINVGRYFVATQAGKNVEPQSRYYLPEPWLKVGQPNELVLFDEHGKLPGKAKLVYDARGPYAG